MLTFKSKFLIFYFFVFFSKIVVGQNFKSDNTFSNQSYYWTKIEKRQIIKISDDKVPNSISLKLSEFLIQEGDLQTFSDSIKNQLLINERLSNRYDDFNPFSTNKQFCMCLKLSNTYICWFEITPKKNYRYLLGFILNSSVKVVAIPLDYGLFENLTRPDEIFKYIKNGKFNNLKFFYDKNQKTFVWQLENFNKKNRTIVQFDADKRQIIKKWNEKIDYGITF